MKWLGILLRKVHEIFCGPLCSRTSPSPCIPPFVIYFGFRFFFIIFLVNGIIKNTSIITKVSQATITTFHR